MMSEVVRTRNLLPRRPSKRTRQCSLLICLTLIMAVTYWRITDFLDINEFSSVVVEQSSLTTFWNPTAKRRSNFAEWQNDYGVVHILQTRFMQKQPHLLHLGRARIHLFATFCLPTIQCQTTQQFLWIIRTDPLLHPELKESLLNLVHDVPNIVVVASNDYPDGFRSPKFLKNIPESSIWSGSFQTLQAYHKAAQTHVVLETRLDADDGLTKAYMEQLQKQAIAMQPQSIDSWKVWCVDSIVEWQQYSPWKNDDTRGALLGVAPHNCVSTGLTWGYHMDATAHDRTITAHNKIHAHLPLCREAKTSCLEWIHMKTPPAAIRARTPTSAGMRNILLDSTSTNKKQMASPWKDQQDLLWQQLFALFGIEAKRVWTLRAYLERHLPEIVSDALAGQCIPGGVPGTCRDTSRQALQSLLKSLSHKQ